MRTLLEARFGRLAVILAAVAASACGSGGQDRGQEGPSPAISPAGPPAPAPAGPPPAEVPITLTDGGFELEGPVEAEPVRFTLRNRTGGPALAFFAQLNQGVTRRDITTAIKESPEALFPLITVAGSFPRTAPDATSEQVIQFPEGEYLLIDPQTQPAPVGFMEVGPATGEAGEPASDYTIEAGEFYFELPETVPAGGTAEIVNAGEQAHELTMVSGDASGGQAAQPFNAILPPPGGRLWATIDVPPGQYQLSCHFADPETGQHHADLGMVAVTTVE